MFELESITNLLNFDSLKYSSQRGSKDAKAPLLRWFLNLKSIFDSAWTYFDSKGSLFTNKESVKSENLFSLRWFFGINFSKIECEYVLYSS